MHAQQNMNNMLLTRINIIKIEKTSIFGVFPNSLINFKIEQFPPFKYWKWKKYPLAIKLWFKYENFWLFQNNSLEGKTHTFHGFALIKHNSSNGFLIEHFSQCWIHSLVAFIEHTVLEMVVLAWLINHFSSFSEILSPTLLNYTPVRFP